MHTPIKEIVMVRLEVYFFVVKHKWQGCRQRNTWECIAVTPPKVSGSKLLVSVNTQLQWV